MRGATRSPAAGAGAGRVRGFEPATQHNCVAFSHSGGTAQEKARGLVCAASRSGGFDEYCESARRRFHSTRHADGSIAFESVATRQRGFTLLEIIVVLAIIAAATLLGAMAVTGGFERMHLQSSSKQILANLRYTRAQAMATGTPQRFVIDPQAHIWQAPNGRHGSVHKSLAIHFIGAREATPARGVGAIVFFPDGASTGGRVQLISGRAAWNVDVKWLTGEVSLRRGEVER